MSAASRVSATIRPEDLTAVATFLGRPAPQQVVPPCWHWFLLLDPVDPANLDDDGQVIGSPSTPDPGMTRMFAGGRVTTHRQLRLDTETTRSSELTSCVDKQGRHGPLRFVTTTSTWSQHGRTCLVDEQDHVFLPRSPREDASDTQAEGTARAEGAGQVDGDGLLVSEPGLVTFSALTSNPYRIHWDRDFCRAQGHDGLVVHGPLQALLAALALDDAGAEFVGKRFSYRFTAPVTAPTRLRVHRDGDNVEVLRPDSTVTTTARLDAAD